MKDRKFKKAYDAHYKELLFSELLISIMEDDDKSVRGLAEEANISPSVIQELRSGKQKDIKVSNLLKIAQAFGFEVVLQKGDERLMLQDKVEDNQHHLSVVYAWEMLINNVYVASRLGRFDPTKCPVNNHR